MAKILIAGKRFIVFIHDAGMRIQANACRLHRHDIYFLRRPRSNEPDAQMFEDGPDDCWVFYAADDKHVAFALRTDQRVYFGLIGVRGILKIAISNKLWTDDQDKSLFQEETNRKMG